MPIGIIMPHPLIMVIVTSKLSVVYFLSFPCVIFFTTTHSKHNVEHFKNIYYYV